MNADNLFSKIHMADTKRGYVIGVYRRAAAVSKCPYLGAQVFPSMRKPELRIEERLL